MEYKIEENRRFSTLISFTCLKEKSEAEKSASLQKYFIPFTVMPKISRKIIR